MARDGLSDASLLELLAEVGPPPRPDSTRADLERALERLPLDALRQRAVQLGIALDAVQGHRGHRRTWIDAIVGRARMEVDGEHEGNPCVGHALVAGEYRPVFETGSGARYHVVPRSGRKEFRLPTGGVVELPARPTALAAAGAGAGAGEDVSMHEGLPVLQLRGTAAPPPRRADATLGSIESPLAAARLGVGEDRGSHAERATVVALRCAGAGGRDLPSPASDAPRDEPRFGAIAPSLRRIEHVPRQNSNCGARPSEADADLAHARLLSRLSAWGLRERVVEGDGNCQFRALADQLWGSQAQHALVRRLACAQLAAAPERYSCFVAETTAAECAGSGGGGSGGEVAAKRAFAAYVARMRAPGAWGDHLTLQAVADRLGVEIALVTSFEGRANGDETDAVVLVTPWPGPGAAGPQAAGGGGGSGGEAKAQHLGDGGRTLWLSFFAEVHYQSLEPATP
ncbi:hypothetical protein KFE25_012689 [Diacronema lutheri]|uniref:OTU domain-containing protein n=1 Tax=Diacronema lutheri TaxID=2081491 RepID=A0A8J5X3M7_DIALT|nr:hypothetical protein KFE25_012689 [Diacronema lutheri]